MTSPLDLAYLAGIIDGEGTISARTNDRGSIDLVFTVANTDLPLILWITQRFGGAVMPVKKYQQKHKLVWRVRWGRVEALTLLPQLIPFLIIKRRRAELYLELATLMGKGERLSDEVRSARHAPMAEMLTLNKRGAA